MLGQKVLLNQMPTAIKDSKIDITSEKSTRELAEKLTSYFKGGEYVFLHGEMGVGKTTFVKYFINKLTKKSQGRSGGGKGISLINRQIGETNVELNISGNISIDGGLVLEEKDLITTNLRESKTWDLEIEQTQRFAIDGNIGDRIFVKIKQDSEADFTWENDLTIEYKGQKNDILQKISM